MIPLIAAGIGAAANLAGSFLSSRAAEERANQNTMQQLAFARHGLKWKVEDAKEAGIHPLYALGASTHSFSPVSVGDTSIGSGLAAAGQDISRGLMATRSKDEQASAFTTAAQKLQLEGLSLDNDLKRARLASQVATVTQAGTPPAFPVPEADKPEERPQLFAGTRWATSPRFSNAEDVEKRYGDAAQELYGLPLFAAEALNNFYQRALEANEYNRNILPRLRPYRGSQNWRGHF